MNGSGCGKCPVKSCDATYRGSRCAAQRSKYKLGDPQTNADCIRAMSDEELCAFIGFIDLEVQGDYVCSFIDGHRFKNEKEILDWLKQEVSE